MTRTADYRSLYLEPRSYPFVAPPELGGGDAGVHPVAIVGGGPIGMAVALELALAGVRSVVLEASDSESPGSRASCISRRSVEILKRLGVGAAFDAAALPWTSGTSFYRDTPVFRLEMPDGADERDRPMSNLQQNILERTLIERIAHEPLIDLRWQQSLAGIAQDADGVTLDVETPDGTYALRADYVVAADGARSAVRRLMGLRLEGEAHAARYLIADIKMHSDHPTERRAWFDSRVHRGSTILMHHQPHDIWRVDIQLRDDDDAEAEQQPERLAYRIQDVLDMAGETASWELDWVSVYRAYSLRLDRYVHGRVAFAGDAAHLVPIFGVKGLNSGIADAENLGWKLAALSQGRGGPALLDSYDAERRAATDDIFAAAGKSTRFMTPPTRGYALMRRAALSLAVVEPWAGCLADPRQSAPFRYPADGINTPGDPAPAGPPVGASIPSARIAGGFLHNRLDARPTLLYFTGHADDARVARTLAGLRDDGVRPILIGAPVPGLEDAERLDDPAGDCARRLGGSPGTYLLLRPDWHVAARGTTPPSPDMLRTALRRMHGFHD